MAVLQSNKPTVSLLGVADGTALLQARHHDHQIDCQKSRGHYHQVPKLELIGSWVLDEIVKKSFAPAKFEQQGKRLDMVTIDVSTFKEHRKYGT